MPYPALTLIPTGPPRRASKATARMLRDDGISDRHLPRPRGEDGRRGRYCPRLAPGTMLVPEPEPKGS